MVREWVRIAPPPPRREGEHVDAQTAPHRRRERADRTAGGRAGTDGRAGPETDPAAEEVVGKTTDKALHSEGTGGFRYEGSGGVTIVGDGIVVVDLSATKDLVKTATGFGSTKASKDGLRTRYQGTGTLTLDGSQYRVKVNGKFTADVDPTATHPATGTARDWGNGETTLKGGVPWPFWSNQRILLTAGPMSVDIFGRGGPLAPRAEG